MHSSTFLDKGACTQGVKMQEAAEAVTGYEGEQDLARK